MATARMSVCPVPVAVHGTPSSSSASSSSSAASSPSAPSCSSSPSCRTGVYPSISAGIPRTRFLGSQLPVLHALKQGDMGEKNGLVSKRFVVHAEYSRRSGGGAGDFMAGFLLGGVLFGTVGYLLAPMISKSIATVKEMQEEEDEIEGPPKKLPKFIEEEDGLEQGTRKSLNEKIAQLNAAIDNVSAQLRADDGTFGMNESPAELESAA